MSQDELETLCAVGFTSVGALVLTFEYLFAWSNVSRLTRENEVLKRTAEILAESVHDWQVRNRHFAEIPKSLLDFARDQAEKEWEAKNGE